MTMLFKIIAIGIGATLILDIWNFLLDLIGVKSLDYRFVGRWIGHFTNGKFLHNNIMKTTAIQNELLIGWTVHYLTGISFSFLLVIVFGKGWLVEPLLVPAMIVGLVTVVFPLFIMQPALGFGIASSKQSDPIVRVLKSIMTHLVYGSGLFITGLLINKITV